MNYCSNKAHRSMIPWHGHQIEGTIWLIRMTHGWDELLQQQGTSLYDSLAWTPDRRDHIYASSEWHTAEMNYCSNKAHRSMIPWHGHQIEGTICLIRMTHSWNELLQQQGTSLYDSLTWTPDRRDHLTHSNDTRLRWITAATRHIALWFLDMDTR